MSYIEIILVALGLSMDAFAVAVCKGLAIKKINFKQMLIVGLWFGGFQALMPALGYILGTTFSQYIDTFDHWIAFGLLCIIGINMIREAFSKEEDKDDDSLGFRTMLLMAIATSIDALAVGVTFAFLHVNLLIAVLAIGVITLVVSCVGVKIGNVFGVKFKKPAELVGGGILILLGIKILLEHLHIFH